MCFQTLFCHLSSHIVLCVLLLLLLSNTYFIQICSSVSLQPHVGHKFIKEVMRPEDDPNAILVYCRMSMRLTRCAESSLGYYNGTNWCESHMCAPSYYPAHKCDPDPKFRADAKCQVMHAEEQKLVWRCKHGRMSEYIPYPFGCTTNCTDTYYLCPCLLAPTKLRELIWIYDDDTECPPEWL